MPPRPFDRFILLADMRTGSNYLEANLNAMAGVTCHGEAFNPAFIGKKDREEYLGVTLAERESDPHALLARMEAETQGLSGFRFFHDHDPRILATSLADRRCAKIILTRNPLESYVSLKIAKATGQWKLGDARRRKAALAEFDADEFEAHVARLQAFQVQIQRTLQVSGQTAFWIGYEDVGDLEVINGLAAFLGVPPLEALDDSVKKQNPGALEDLLANPEALSAGLARLDRFNLARTPNFEPRRGPAVPSYIASADLPLLYLPLKGGPEEALRDWLSNLGPKGLLEGFNQKSLKAWQKNNPGLRSFTVLRHPLLRAHAAFRDRILSGAAGEIRGVLKRNWKIDLPPPERLHRMSPEDQGAAFLQFLRFLKGNLAGQTSVRVDATWASQTSVLQGFSSQILPDLLLREEELPEALPRLAPGAPPYRPKPEPAIGHPLASFVAPEHQAAAREVYARDYLAFGYEDWRG